MPQKTTAKTTPKTQAKTQPKTPPKTDTKTQTTTTTSGRKPSEQALQVVDVAVGAPPTVAETVRSTADTWTNSEARSKEIDALQKRVQHLRDRKGRSAEIEFLRKRLAAELEKAESKGGDVRRQVTDQLVGRARKARERVEPTVKRVRERV